MIHSSSFTGTMKKTPDSKQRFISSCEFLNKYFSVYQTLYYLTGCICSNMMTSTLKLGATTVKGNDDKQYYII